METKIIYLSQSTAQPFVPRYYHGKEDDPQVPDFKQLMECIKHDVMRGEIYDYEVRLSAGTYYLPSPILIDSTVGAKITFTKQGKGEVILSGGRRITGFVPETVNGIPMLVADIPAVRTGEWYFEELYVNKEWRSRPVSPAGGKTHRIKNVPCHPIDNYGSPSVSSFEAERGIFDGITNLTDTTIEVLHFWLSERMNVTGYDKETGLVSFDRFPRMRLTDSTAPAYANYRILNVFEALKEAGQWYLNRKTGKLYYIPLAGETADNILVEAPVLQNLVIITGEAQKPVTDITFRDLIFECTKSDPCDDDQKIKYATFGQAAANRDGAITMTYAKNIGFDRVTLRSIGNYAIEGKNGTENLAIEACEIYNTGAGGVKVTGASASESEKDASHGVRVENCYIHHCTRVDYGAIGIYLSHVNGIRLAHNEICNLKYSGISVGWVWGMLPSRAGNAIIEYNHVHHCGDGDMSDMGGIYLLGPQCGTEVRGNYVHDIRSAVYGGEGIYLDEGSTAVVVEKNVIYDCDSACFMIHYGSENIIRYNIIGHGDANVAIGAATTGNYLNMFKNIYFVEDNPVYLGAYNVSLTFPILESDMNFIYKTTDTPLYNLHETKLPEMGNVKKSWEDWTAQGMDTMTKVYAAEKPILKTPEELKQYGFPLVDAALAGRKPC